MAAWITLLLPAVEIAGAGYLFRRIRWTGYPALMSYLVFESAFNAWNTFDYRTAVLVGMLPRMALRAWVVWEVFRLSRSCWPLSEVRKTAISAVCAVSGVVALLWWRTHLSPLDTFFLARQYYHIGLAAALWALVMRSFRWPMLEHRRNRAYRYGMAVWMTVMAVGSTFTRGGLGYGLFDYTEDVWMVARLAVCACLAVTAGGLCLGMGVGEPYKRAVRIAGCARRSNVIEMGRAA
jgi:hypothetical protein